MKFTATTLEVLEQRIAPAVFTYHDAAGVAVTVTTSKGSDADLAGALTLTVSGTGQLLQKIDFATHPIFKGTDLTIEAAGMVPVANVGALDAHGLDLGTVTIDGDLGQIDAGDTNVKTPALKTLHLGSLGVQTDTQAGTASFESLLVGPLTQLTLDGDLAGSLLVHSGTAGKITTATIHGSIVGGATAASGSIDVSGSIETLTVDRMISGGAGDHSGSVHAAGPIGTIKVTGAINGGLGTFSGTLTTPSDITRLNLGSVTGTALTGATQVNGEVHARKFGTVTVSGALTGGLVASSGSILADRSITSITVSGGLAGGPGVESGSIQSGTIAKAVIGTGLLGGNGDRSGSVLGVTLSSVEVTGFVKGGVGAASGSISSTVATGKVVVQGQMSGGSGDNSGSIGSGGKITGVTIDGGILGGGGYLSGSVAAVGAIGTVVVGIGIEGGSGAFSGSIGALGTVALIDVAGSVEGGSGIYSGVLLSSKSISKVVIEQSLRGGSGPSSGRVESGILPAVSISQNLEGGSGQDAGTIFAASGLGKIEILGSLLGSTGKGSDFASTNASVSSNGPITSVHVAGDVKGGLASQSGSIFSNSNIGTVTVDGSLVGGSQFHSGSIFTRNVVNNATTLPSLTKVVIGNYVLGGAGENSGSIESAGKLSGVTIGVAPVVQAQATIPTIQRGSLNGGTGEFSGLISSVESLGTVTLLGGISGLGNNTGVITSNANILRITVGGSVTGSGDYFIGNDTRTYLGQILARGTIGALTVNGDLLGGQGAASASVVAGAINSVVVHGNLVGGNGFLSGSLRTLSGNLASLTVDQKIDARGDGQSLYISSSRNIGVITAGSILGEGGSVYITAAGVVNPKSATAALAIKSIKTVDQIHNTRIYAGIAGLFNTFSLQSRSASIGTVEVGTATTDPSEVYVDNDIVAGFFPDGTSGTTASSLNSTIAKVVIHGSILGTGSQRIIAADHLTAITVDGTAVALRSGAKNDAQVQVGGGNSQVIAIEIPLVATP